MQPQAHAGTPEFQQAYADLKAAIAAEIEAYQDKTGLVVTAINIEHKGYTSMDKVVATTTFITPEIRYYPNWGVKKAKQWTFTACSQATTGAPSKPLQWLMAKPSSAMNTTNNASAVKNNAQ